MAYFGRKLQYTIEQSPPIFLGGGVNTFVNPFMVDKSEAVSSLNTSSRLFPSLSVRPGLTYLYGTGGGGGALTAVKSAGVRNASTFHVQDGTTWKYWNGSAFTNVATGLTAAIGKIIEFNTTTNRYTILVNGTDKKYWNGSGAASDITDGPATSLYVTDDDRLYALLGSVLYCSAADSVTDWTTVDDADQIPLVGMAGVGVALASYNDMVIAWGDQTMHVILGNDSFDFTRTEPISNGCVSDRSVVVHNGILYFMDYNQIMAFTGGLPFEMSQKVRTYLQNINYTYKSGICSGKWGKYIYWSIPHGASATGNNLTLEYDTENKTWYVWNIGFTNFVNINDDLIGIDTSGHVCNLQTGTADAGTAITWEHTTGVWDAFPVKPHKADGEYNLIIDLPISSTLTLAYAEDVDGSTFTTIKTFAASANEQNVRIKIPTNQLHNFNWKRLKFAGTGPCTIYCIEESDKRINVR